MTTTDVDTALQLSESDGSAEESNPIETDSLSDLDDCEFHDCLEMETLYLSFDTQDLRMALERGATVAEDKATMAEINEMPEETNHKRTESDAFYSCDGQPLEGQKTINPGDGSVHRSETSEASSSDVDEWTLRRRTAFMTRRVDSIQQDMIDTSHQTQAEGSTQCEPTTPLLACHLGDSFNKDEQSSTSPEMTSTPDMLVTLTTTDMGISAKNDDHFVAPQITPLQSASTSEDAWNTDYIHDSSIFDKARLVEEALDTVDIRKCMLGKTDAVQPLPSLAVQERYSDEGRSVRQSYASTSSSIPHVYPVLPSYRIEHVRSDKLGLERSRSAPSEMKDNILMVEDMEISTITGQGFHPLSIDDRPVSSLSAPFEEVLQTSDNGCKKCLASWVRKKKMQFVSFDAESDTASMTRSEYIMDLRSGKERYDDECQRQIRRHQKRSSRFGYINGFVIGPSVSPVPPGGIQDFGRDDAIALNAVLRNDPTLAHVPMGEWTSKLIGFATPADYYVHMIHELSQQNINVLALITARLGDQHPLVTEIIDKLRNYTTEVPSFIFGIPKGHRRTPPLASHQKLPLFSGLSEDYADSLESSLVRCGVNVASFDKLRCAFTSDHDYYEYISQQIRSAEFDIKVSKLKEHLGEGHPFIEVFQVTTVSGGESANKTEPMSDSARSIESMTPKSSPRTPASSKVADETGMPRCSGLKREDERAMSTSGCSCWGGLSRRFARKFAGKNKRRS